MKRKVVLSSIAKVGAVLLRHGTRHDIYINPKTKIQQPVPRHTDIPEPLARKIIQKLS